MNKEEEESEMARALITPNMLMWARERAHISIEMLSQKLNTTVERLESWEAGESKPTIKQAQNIAQKLHVPFGYLYLTTPPEEKMPIPDLRTLGDNAPGGISVDFRDLLNDVKRKQSWYREYALENGLEPFEYLGAFTINSDIKEVARSIRSALIINAETRRVNNTKEAYLKVLTERAEALGVLVMRSSVVGSNNTRGLSVEEFRGFALSDEYAPLIFINSTDSNSAKIFTLIHELAHLWINKSGISSIEFEVEEEKDEEAFCNAVSAEVLVPENQFERMWDDDTENDENISLLSIYFRVSVFVIARRAMDLGFVSRSYFFDYYRRASEEFEAVRIHTRENRGSGGQYYANIWTRNGKRFTTAVVSSSLNNSTLFRDAGKLLNMGPNNIKNLARELGV